jgi:UDP-sulfoquinovose synthase
MRILILGADGYLGWPAMIHFANLGHEVAGVDNMIKRYWEAQVGVSPIQPIEPLVRRQAIFKEASGLDVKLYIGDIADNPKFVYSVFDDFKPEAVIHLGEQPSAPYSMRDRSACVDTQRNNIVGNLNVMFAIQRSVPDCHLVKLGTMGEYGTPNIRIEEGWLEVEHRGRKDRVLYPKKPGSFYHCSKVADSVNLEFACRVWGARVTDLNQGVVYGFPHNNYSDIPGLHTSFHYDAVFGTVLNRFMAQAIVDYPLTVYGNGSQTRGYLHIDDTLKCLEIACNNPANTGEFQVFNQFTETFSVLELAKKVSDTAEKMFGKKCALQHLTNPRVEQYDHFYEAVNSGLLERGLEPKYLDERAMASVMERLERNKNTIRTSEFAPQTCWKNP